MSKCLLHKECKHYRKTSETCNNGGNDYCGKYRENMQNKLLKEKFKKVKISKNSFNKLLQLVECYNKTPENSEKKTLGSFLETFIDDCYQHFTEKGRLS